MKLSLTQLKQIRDNGYSIREAVDQLNDIPEWAHLDSICEIQSIVQCGTASNAHISCFYADAKRIFMENSSDIETVLENHYCEGITWNVQMDTFDQFISNLLQSAVEAVCHDFADMLDGVEWE